MTDAELIEGVTLRIGRRDYVVPPLNLRGVKRAQALMPALAGDGPESVDAGVEVILLALQRNYPDVTREQLEEDVDLGNLTPLIEAVLKIAGFRDPKATGATPAQAAAALSLGTESTPGSPAPPGGPGSTSTAA